jgi:hypothetical protein
VEDFDKMHVMPNDIGLLMLLLHATHLSRSFCLLKLISLLDRFEVSVIYRMLLELLIYYIHLTRLSRPGVGECLSHGNQ